MLKFGVDEDGAVTVDKQLVAASKGNKVSVNQIVVPYGKRSKIILPDGSSLWINSVMYFLLFRFCGKKEN